MENKDMHIDARLQYGEDELATRIRDLLVSPRLIDTLCDMYDLFAFLRTGRLSDAVDLLKEYSPKEHDGRAPTMLEPLYELHELGRLLECMRLIGTCPCASECSIDRLNCLNPRLHEAIRRRDQANARKQKKVMTKKVLVPGREVHG